MLWRWWGLGWNDGGCCFHWSHLDTHCKHIVHALELPRRPFCLNLWLPLSSPVLFHFSHLTGGSQWLFRTWVFLTTCSPHAPSTQQFLSVPLSKHHTSSAISLHPTATVRVHPVGITTWTTPEAFKLISCHPCLDFRSPSAMLQLNVVLWKRKSEHSCFCFNPRFDSY